MTDLSSFDPYAGNLLTEGLGPIQSRSDVLMRLSFIPPPTRDIGKVPLHIRIHMLMGLRDLHIANLEGARLQQTIDLMIRQSYRYRDPLSPQTWSIIGGESIMHKTPRAPAMAAVAVGHSGTGKTENSLRSCGLYPQQVIVHPSFPKLDGPHHQVVWQSVDVPSSGRSEDLAANLMAKWDEIMAKHAPSLCGRFSATLNRERRDGQKMLDEWRQVAIGHFLGLLHLDEVQNFFKLPSLAKRRKKNGNPEDLELSIIEDQCLKWILTLTNTWQIPILLSGTPDGVGALTKRLANIQRFVTCGYHPFRQFDNPDDPAFTKGFLAQLARYQFVDKPLAVTAELAELIIRLTAGIQRLIIALWIAAHRVAFERKDDDLRLGDFQKAADTYLAPIAPAVAALRSGDPKLMARYEDLIRRDDNYWSTFWCSMVSA
jgi:hypothetical protein